jgi:hypothetical protein
MKNWIYIITCLILSGCFPCHTTTVENGPLPNSALELVPYQKGNTYKLKHSNGLVISFETTRETQEEYTYCTECCKYIYHFEINTTKLSPDYPIFNCDFGISNRDTTHLDCYASIGKSVFYIPTENTENNYYEKVDSLILNSIVYYNVFKLKTDYDSYYNQDSIYADSLFYNYEHGILKVLMSNEEYYEIIK